MATIPSQDDKTPKDASSRTVDSHATEGRSDAAEPVDGSVSSLPSLSTVESLVLAAMSENRHSSIGLLRSRTGLDSEELRVVLDGLRSKGLVTRLNTIVESYSSRFPGLRVGD